MHVFRRTRSAECVLFLIGLCFFACSGCAKSLVTIDQARGQFASGNLPAARQSLQKLADAGDRFSDAAELDLAIVEIAAGDHRAAESRLRRLRDRFDALPTLTPLRDSASLVSDDTMRRFRPAGYEQVMIRTMLAVCSMAGDSADAESYTIQAISKQNELAREAEQRGILEAVDVYQPIAIAPYLRGVIREATHHNYDDAEQAYRLVSRVRPQFAPAAADIQRASGGTHSAPGHGVLYVIACVGDGPMLEETVAPTTSTALSIASAVVNAETNQDEDDRVGAPVLPNIAEVKIPAVVVPRSNLAALSTRIDGKLYGATQTLTDVGELAVRQNEAERPWTIARSVLRRATKEATVATVGDSLGLNGSAGSIFHFVTATAWAGAEHADTRCWGLLPREIQVLRAELPVGPHQVQLEPLGWDGQPFQSANTQNLVIQDGRNHYLIAIARENAIYVSRSGNQ